MRSIKYEIGDNIRDEIWLKAEHAIKTNVCVKPWLQISNNSTVITLIYIRNIIRSNMKNTLKNK